MGTRRGCGGGGAVAGDAVPAVSSLRFLAFLSPSFFAVLVEFAVDPACSLKFAHSLLLFAVLGVSLFVVPLFAAFAVFAVHFFLLFAVVVFAAFAVCLFSLLDVFAVLSPP